MGNKGFSLVELLAVIAILSIILLIFTPNITRLVDDFKSNKKEEILKNNAISAAKEYVVDGKANTNGIDCYNEPVKNTFYVTIKELIENKYLEVDKEDILQDKKITVTYDCNNKKYIKYEFED